MLKINIKIKEHVSSDSDRVEMFVKHNKKVTHVSLDYIIVPCLDKYRYIYKHKLLDKPKLEFTWTITDEIIKYLININCSITTVPKDTNQVKKHRQITLFTLARGAAKTY